MVVPTALHSHILQELHEGTLSGHLWTAKTIGKLKEFLYWPGHYNNTLEWCQKWEVCATHKTPVHTSKAALVLVFVSSLLALVAVGILSIA